MNTEPASARPGAKARDKSSTTRDKSAPRDKSVGRSITEEKPTPTLIKNKTAANLKPEPKSLSKVKSTANVTDKSEPKQLALSKTPKGKDPDLKKSNTLSTSQTEKTLKPVATEGNLGAFTSPDKTVKSKKELTKTPTVANLKPKDDSSNNYR